MHRMKSCSFIVPQPQPAMGAKDVYEISLPRHSIYLFAMKNVECTTVRVKLELELALNLRWYTTIRYLLVPALTRMMWKRGDLLFQERSIVYLPRCIGVTFVRSSSWNYTELNFVLCYRNLFYQTS